MNEKISVGYQKWETIGCVGGLGSLDLLNYTYQLQYNSCHDPASIQTTLSHTGKQWETYLVGKKYEKGTAWDNL